MIERLLAADAALADGELEAASRLFAQVVVADPRNAIAVVGLARIAMRQGRAEEARELLARALDIDPDEAAAQRLIRELSVPAPAPIPAPGPIVTAIQTPGPLVTPEPALAPAPTTTRRPSLLDRLRAWLARRGRQA